MSVPIKKIILRVAHELIPAPTLNRLLRVRRALKTPSVTFLKLGDWVAQRLLPPQSYINLRAYMKRILRPAAKNSETVNPAQNSETVNPAQNSETVNPVQLYEPIRNSKPVERKSKIFFSGNEYSSFNALVSDHGGKISCSLVVCCAFYGRHEILELVLKEGQHVAEDSSVHFCIVGSTKEDEAFLRKINEQYANVLGFTFENRPVGRKWQRAVSAACASFDFELLGITGSDDILSSYLMDRVISRHRYNLSSNPAKHLIPGVYATLEWLVYGNSATQPYYPQIIKCNYKGETAIEPAGGGRFYSSEFVELAKCTLFDDSLNRLLDDFGYEEIVRLGAGVEYYGIDEGVLLSVKGDWVQMNDWNALTTADSIDVTEYSFKGYEILRRMLSTEVFDQIFLKGALAVRKEP